MRFHFNPSKLLIIGFIVFLWINDAGCQRNISPQAQRAIDFFDNKQFTIAQTEFQKVIERFPQDPLYQYYFGATLAELNIQPSQALEYLKTATTKNVNIDSWHYLALENYRLFKFNEALIALSELKKRAKWQENKRFETSKELERLRYAPKFFSKAIQPEIIAKTQVRNDSILSYLMRNLKYKTVKIGKLSKFDEPVTIFTDSAIIPERYYYFSAKTNLNFRGKDIFRIKMKTDSTWTTPENLGQIINTSDDEDFPIFDYHSNMLYFASQGHESVGEFDIFKSKYSTTKNEWSEPEQLCFPINSQWNDYLYFEE